MRQSVKLTHSQTHCRLLLLFVVILLLLSPPQTETLESISRREAGTVKFNNFMCHKLYKQVSPSCAQHFIVQLKLFSVYVICMLTEFSIVAVVSILSSPMLCFSCCVVSWRIFNDLDPSCLGHTFKWGLTKAQIWYWFRSVWREGHCEKNKGEGVKERWQETESKNDRGKKNKIEEECLIPNLEVAPGLCGWSKELSIQVSAAQGGAAPVLSLLFLLHIFPQFGGRHGTRGSFWKGSRHVFIIRCLGVIPRSTFSRNVSSLQTKSAEFDHFKVKFKCFVHPRCLFTPNATE